MRTGMEEADLARRELRAGNLLSRRRWDIGRCAVDGLWCCVRCPCRFSRSNSTLVGSKGQVVMMFRRRSVVTWQCKLRPP